MKPRTRLFQLVAVALVTLVAGCELIVDFDRTKIPVEGTDGGGTPDSGNPDTGSPADAGDGAADAPSDGPGTDAADAASDAPQDG